MHWDNTDDMIRALLSDLPRPERAYAASYAHWIAEMVDPDEAIYQAMPYAIGIPAARRAWIRRIIDRTFQTGAVGHV